MKPVLLILMSLCSMVGSVQSSHSLFALASCDTVNTSLHMCMAKSNCSGRQKFESCRLQISIPPEDAEISSESSGKPTLGEIWIIGGISVGLISLSGVVGALLWPAINSPLYRHLMRLLIGLAVGSLTSTALFQLIPEGYLLKEFDEEMTYLYTALFAWISVWAIYVIESLSKIIFHHNTICHPDQVETVLTEVERNNLLLNKKEKELPAKKGRKVAAVAWMVIIGDGLHNFIDGMTIGAGYTQNLSTGIGLSLGIAAEEFPHELGDFAILVQSGMPIFRALLCNFLSACTAFLGFILGVILGQIKGSQFIFSFAAGLFLYISLTHLIPELKSMLAEDLKISRKASIIGLALQNVGMLTGTVLIFFITKYNDNITALTS